MGWEPKTPVGERGEKLQRPETRLAERFASAGCSPSRISGRGSEDACSASRVFVPAASTGSTSPAEEHAVQARDFRALNEGARTAATSEATLPPLSARAVTRWLETRAGAAQRTRCPTERFQPEADWECAFSNHRQVGAHAPRQRAKRRCRPHRRVREAHAHASPTSAATCERRLARRQAAPGGAGFRVRRPEAATSGGHGGRRDLRAKRAGRPREAGAGGSARGDPRLRRAQGTSGGATCERSERIVAPDAPEARSA